MASEHSLLDWLFRAAWLVASAALITACDVSDSSPGGFKAGDPVVVDYPIAYVERTLPVDEDGEPAQRAVLDPAAFFPGARLVLKARASASAMEQVITDDVFPRNEDGSPALYDVKDLATSPDGSKLLFAMRAPEIPNADDDEQPKWNIWEYDVENDTLERVISEETNILAEAGHDVAPQYLPDGRILFSSTRQSRSRAILLDESKPQYTALDDKRQEEAFLLHVLAREGGTVEIEQITFNASQDLQPTVLDDGDILFLRRDGIANHDRLSLYRVKPDGTDLQLYYGYHSQETGTNDSEGVFARPLELEDGRVMVNLVPRETLHLGGDVVAIDGADFIDVEQPTRANAGAAGPGQNSLIANPVDSEGASPSRGGYYSSAYPLYDGTERLLVSWSQCRLVDPATGAFAPCTDALIEAGAEQAPPAYGLWIYDVRSGTQLPVKLPQEDLMYFDAVVLSPRPVPTAWMPQDDQPTLVGEAVGVLHIRSIYDRDGLDSAPGGLAAIADPARTPTDSRERRFLRIVKNVAIPDGDVREIDNSAFGVSAAQGMRDILGYVPLEPDGSAKFKVPADMPFMVDVVDARGKRVGQRHQNWLHLRPGEIRECTGCHTPDSRQPHGRRDAEATTANPGAVGGMPFPNTLLRDQFGTPQPNPEFGESMAEYYARLYGPRTPSMDMVFTDEWTNPANDTPGADIQLRYVDIQSTINLNPKDPNCAPLDIAPPTWASPHTCTIEDGWKSRCRVTIHYIDHIHPLWEADRRTCDELGNVTEDRTCTVCHSRGPADAVQVPAGQLQLTGGISLDRNDFLTSYAELMFQDNTQEVVENSLTDVLVEQPTGEYQTDDDGNLLVDENGEPIPLTLPMPIPVQQSMSTAGARSSNRFFRRFEQYDSSRDTVNHVEFLSPAELKLIAEWLDIGGQYYNDPFVAPAD